MGLDKSYPQLRTTSSKVIHKLSTRIINVINRFNVRQTDVNVDVKRFTVIRRTLTMVNVCNVRKSYPQAKKSYPQVIHRRTKLSTGSGKLSTSYPQAEANVCSAGRGRGANVCLGRRASKRFLQIFKTRVIISYRIELSNVFQSYPTYSKAIQRIPNISSSD